MEQLQRGETPEPIAFGLCSEFDYSGHLTQASHLVPLPKRVFASSDKTHIRIWGAAGDITKTTFPANRRSMVSAMAFCPSFNVLLTTEVDMTLKVYSVEKLDILETFSLAQERKRAQGGYDKGRGSQKIQALAYLPKNNWLIIGGECGTELWKLTKSTQRRVASVGKLEFQLSLELIRQVTADAVFRVITNPVEQRVIVCGPEVLHILDMDMVPLASRRKPHVGPVCSACVHVVSIIDTALLTGGADGAVNFWSIQGKQPLQSSVFERPDGPTEEERLPASMRLEHSFTGHSRPVEMVCFYHRLEHRVRQRLIVSLAHDCKMKVWSLEQFSVVYTLDVSFIDSRAMVFPLAPHSFAVSSAQAPGDSSDPDKDAGTTVMLMRFTANIAMPFATTNQSAVLQIAQPTHMSFLSPGAPQEPTSGLFGVAALVSEDMAIRVVDAEALRLISTLPPPPNSKVQVLCAFLCPVWRLLVLWLSSQEIAIFFIPEGKKLESPASPEINTQTGTKSNNENEESANMQRTKNTTAPLLIRRFSILEVRAPMFDKALSKEAFNSMSLHHGQALPNCDSLMSRGFEPNLSEGIAESKMGEFLLVGTKQGTLLAFHLGNLLGSLNIWERLVLSLPDGAWEPPIQTDVPSAPKPTDPRLMAIEQEHFEAMERFRVPGQRPFPRGGAPLILHGRWRSHDYAVMVTESVGNTILTIDAKHNLRFWQTRDMQLLFHFQLSEYTCYATFLQPLLGNNCGESSPRLSLPKQNTQELVLGGFAIGTASGTVQLIIPNSIEGEEATVLQSHATHADAVIQLDFGWPSNVFLSAGKDNAVKIWSRKLQLIKEVVFPQELTTIAFRRRQDLDATRGHGNILLGFAAHVEQISLEYWSRGIPQTLFGEDSDFTLQTKEDNHGTRGYNLLEHVDNIDSHSFYLHVESPPSVAPKKKRGININNVTKVSTFAQNLLSATRSQQQPSKMDSKKARGQNCEIMDFRGGPVMPVGILSGSIADPKVLDVANWPAKEPIVEHCRGDTLDHGDFRDITRCHPGYYDWNVDPNTVVDAISERAIRGTVASRGQAVVTSLGIGHLRHTGRRKQAEPSGNSGGASSRQASPRAGNGAMASSASSLRANSASKHPKDSTGPRRPFARPQRLSAANVNLATEESLQAKAPLPPRQLSAPSEASSGPIPRLLTADSNIHESWRDEHVARGVPKFGKSPKPRSQALAASDDDVALMLKQRGHLTEAPEPAETNFLKALFQKKAEWVYCPAEQNQRQQQQTSRDSHTSATSTSHMIWTNAGRMVETEGAPPRHAVPPPTELSPLQRLNMRTPMTRAEVTELRLIENAMHGPPPPVPDLSVESLETWQRRHPPNKQHPAGSVRSISPQSARCRKRRSSMGSIMEETMKAPMTAR